MCINHFEEYTALSKHLKNRYQAVNEKCCVFLEDQRLEDRLRLGGSGHSGSWGDQRPNYYHFVYNCLQLFELGLKTPGWRVDDICFI